MPACSLAPPRARSFRERWTHYLHAWTRWNTVRRVAPPVSLVLYVLAMV